MSQFKKQGQTPHYRKRSITLSSGDVFFQIGSIISHVVFLTDPTVQNQKAGKHLTDPETHSCKYDCFSIFYNCNISDSENNSKRYF